MEKLFALGHSRCDQAAAKRRPTSAKSHRPPAVHAVVTELSGSVHASYKQSHHGCGEHCVPRKPTIAIPTCSRTRFAPPVVGSPQTFQHHVSKETRRVRAHTHSFSNLQRKRWTQKKNEVARGSCLLHDVVGQQTGITSSINRKCEDSQLEMGQTSNCRRERTHGSSRKLSDVNAKHREVEPSAAVVMCRNETPRHVQQKTIKNLLQRLYVSVPERNTTRGDAKTADMIPFFSSKDDSNKLPLKTTASWRTLHTAILKGSMISGIILTLVFRYRT